MLKDLTGAHNRIGYGSVAQDRDRRRARGAARLVIGKVGSSHPSQPRRSRRHGSGSSCLRTRPVPAGRPLAFHVRRGPLETVKGGTVTCARLVEDSGLAEQRQQRLRVMLGPRRARRDCGDSRSAHRARHQGRDARRSRTKYDLSTKIIARRHTRPTTPPRSRWPRFSRSRTARASHRPRAASTINDQQRHALTARPGGWAEIVHLLAAVPNTTPRRNSSSAALTSPRNSDAAMARDLSTTARRTTVDRGTTTLDRPSRRQVAALLRQLDLVASTSSSTSTSSPRRSWCASRLPLAMLARRMASPSFGEAHSLKLVSAASVDTPS